MHAIMRLGIFRQIWNKSSRAAGLRKACSNKIRCHIGHTVTSNTGLAFYLKCIQKLNSTWDSIWHKCSGFYLTNILTFCLTFRLTFYLAFLLAFYLTLTYILILPGILPDIYSDILPGTLSSIYSDVLSDICSGRYMPSWIRSPRYGSGWVAPGPEQQCRAGRVGAHGDGKPGRRRRRTQWGGPQSRWDKLKNRVAVRWPISRQYLTSSDPRPDTLFWHSFWHIIWKYIILTFYPTFFLANTLVAHHVFIPSGILSGIYSDILSCIYSGILSGFYSDILSGIYSDVLSCICSGILSGFYSDILSVNSGILPGIFSGIHSGIYSDFPSGILFGILSCVWAHVCPAASEAR